MNVILGPCPCHDYGQFLYWDGDFWLGEYGAVHACTPTARASIARKRARLDMEIRADIDRLNDLRHAAKAG